MPTSLTIVGDEHGTVAAALTKLESVGLVVDPTRISVEYLDEANAQSRLRAGMSELWHEGSARAQIEFIGLVYGRVWSEANSPDKLADFLARSVLEGLPAAFYDPTTGAMVLLQRHAAEIARAEDAVLHELVHAYQDERVPGGLLGMFRRARSLDETRAVHLVIEGHSEAVALAVLREAKGRSLEDLELDTVPAGLDGINTGVWADMHALGLRAALVAHRDGGWPALDEFLLDPPPSTEQLLHPEKRGRDQPIEIAAPTLEGARVRESTVVGEVSIRAALTTGGISEDVALLASQGWAGDRLVTYDRDGDRIVVWRTQWDRPEDASAFAMAMYRLPERPTMSIVEHDADVVDIVMVPSTLPLTEANVIASALPRLPPGPTSAARLSAEVEDRYRARIADHSGIVADGMVDLPAERVRLRLPEGWTYTYHPIDGSHIIEGPREGGFADSLTVSSMSAWGEGLDPIIDDLRASIERVGTIEIVALERHELHGRSVVWTETIGGWPSRPPTHQFMVTARHGGAYVTLTAATLSARWEANQAPLRALLEEARFVDDLPRADPGQTESAVQSGCSDGERELFTDLAEFPDVAGCLGAWPSFTSLRAAPTGRRCGDDAGLCEVPADVCAPGWHVCAQSGNPADLSSRLTARQCYGAGPGQFSAAVSHSVDDEIGPCTPIGVGATLPCSDADLGAEPVCCGSDCLGVVCKDGVWTGQTRASWAPSEHPGQRANDGCNAVASTRGVGVLCCSDPPRQ